MTTFDERKKGFESKYKRDQELEFKAQARRNKLLGLWAAELMGLSSTDAEAYAKEVVRADFHEPGDADVLRKVMDDLEAKGAPVAEHTVRRRMDELLAQAREQVKRE